MKNKFSTISLGAFLIPLTASINYKIYSLSAVLLLVMGVSLFYHLSGSRKFYRADVFFAWLLMITNSILIILGRFSEPYFILALISAGLALFIYFRQDRSEYHHGIWHILSAAVTLFSLLTYVF